MEKILADTSAWVASFSKTGHESLKETMRKSIQDGALVTTGIVLLELLQGVRNEAALDALRKKLQVLPSLHTPETIWIGAARWSLHLRTKGVQVSTPDMMIATIALEHDCVVLHCDRDYERMKKYIPLKTLPLI